MKQGQSITKVKNQLTKLNQSILDDKQQDSNVQLIATKPNHSKEFMKIVTEVRVQILSDWIILKSTDD